MHFVLMLLTSSSYRGKADGCQPFTRFFLHGVQICKRTFSFVHAVGKERLENLCKTVDSNGVVQSIHGNAKQPRQNQTTEAEVISVRDFITNVGNTHSLPSPNKLPNATDKTLLCLQICQKRKCTYRDYKFVCEQNGIAPVGQSTLYKFWSSLVSTIDTMKPSSDLCFECQQNISKSYNPHTCQKRPSQSGYSRLRHICSLPR